MLLEACRLQGVGRVIVASSDKAYGRHTDLPYRETHSLGAVYPYDVSKAAADLKATRRFRRERADWPGQTVLRRRVEKLLYDEEKDAKTVRAFFSGVRPVSGEGKIALVADETFAPPWGFLRFVDISDLAAPVQVGTFQTADGAAGAEFCSSCTIEGCCANFWPCCADAGPAIVAARIVAAKIVVARIVMARLTSNAASIHRRCILWRSRAANVYHIIEGGFAARAVGLPCNPTQPASAR